MSHTKLADNINHNLGVAHLLASLMDSETPPDDVQAACYLIAEALDKAERDFEKLTVSLSEQGAQS